MASPGLAISGAEIPHGGWIVSDAACSALTPAAAGSGVDASIGGCVRARRRAASFQISETPTMVRPAPMQISH
jgi:hypothetical protein